MAAKWTLPIEQGSTLRFSFVYSRATGALDVDGLPIYEPHDLTGAALVMEIRDKPGGVLLARSSSVPGDGITTTANPGEIVVEFSAEKTRAINVKKAAYDLEITYPSGDVKRALQGSATISLEVTTSSVVDGVLVDD